jgi:membrane protease YdiL (CAAX protease family)
MLTGKFTVQEMGVGRPSLARSVWIISFGMLLAASIPLLAALFAQNTPPTHALPFHAAWKYVIWSFVQQFMLQSFFFLRLESLLGGRRAVMTTAFLFAAAHIPNPVLTVLCLFGGLFFCEMFRRFRNIFPLGLVHAIFGLIIAASFSDAVLHHMRVGIGYVMFHS